MTYKLYDINGNEITFEDLQDKGPWCQKGQEKEIIFIQKYGNDLNLTLNPEKEESPYPPDLLNLVTYRLGDLKTQNTPFFESKRLYNLDPQFSVTFNQKDYERYSLLYPETDIYYWVDWLAIRYKNERRNIDIVVRPMSGIWFIPFERLRELIESRMVPLHRYSQRVNDTRGNARSSYVLTLNHPFFTRLF